MMSKEVSPTYEEVMSDAHAIAKEHSDIVSVDEAGRSEEGRPIPLLTVTDGTVSKQNKTVLFLTGGTHGCEEVGRAITLELVRWLTEPQNRLHIERQVFLIIPCVNPDGAVLNSYHNARDVNIYKAFPPWAEPTTAEGRAVWSVGKEWIPDGYADCHGLAGGAMGDSEYIHTGYGPDFGFASAMYVTQEMNRAAHLAGFPQRTPSIMGLRDESKNSIPDKFVSEFHTFSLTVETTENYYPLTDSIRSGLARLTKLVEMGERIHCFQPYPNYPTDVITGNEVGALMPYGADYESRRQNRRLATMMIHEGVPQFQRQAADKGRVARVAMKVEDGVKNRPEGVAIQLTIDRRAVIVDAKWNGKKLKAEKQGDGWTSWMTEAGIVVRAEVLDPPKIGENLLEVAYKVPFKPHVEPA